MPRLHARSGCGSVAQIRPGWQASGHFVAIMHACGAMHCNDVVSGALTFVQGLPEYSPETCK